MISDFITSRLESKSARDIWVILSVISLGGIIEIPFATNLSQPNWLLWVYTISISLFKGGLLMCIYVMASRNKWTRLIIMTLIGIYILFCVINIFSFLLYGFGITHRLVTVLMQSNMREIKEFMPDIYDRLFSAGCILTVVGVVVATWLFCKIVELAGKRLYLIILSAASISGLISMIICLATFDSKAILIMGIRVPKNIVNTVQENREYQKIIDSKRPLPYADKVESPHEPLTIVMVIGESAHRKHHQIYGYPLPTTPELWSMRDSLFIFKDAISSSEGTAGNIERILSLKVDDRTCGDWYKFPLVYDIFNAAGFKTFWLSNQERKGFVSNSSGVMANGADVVDYVGIESSEDAYAYRYDGVLLSPVKKALSDTAMAKFIGIHLLGSHGRYINRYPEEESIFTSGDVLKHYNKPWLNEQKATLVAQYDNSIHYTDKLLGEVIKRCSAITTPVILLYFSDHGEMVYDTEDFTGRNEQSVEVPFVIYANYKFRLQHPELVQQLSRAISLPISTARISMSLLTIAGIRYPLYDATNDFLSSSYRIRPRLVDEKIWRYETVGRGNRRE